MLNTKLWTFSVALLGLAGPALATTVLTVPSNNTKVWSPVLDNGQWYQFEASGTWWYMLGRTSYADAEWVWIVDTGEAVDSSKRNSWAELETLINYQDVTWWGTTDGVDFAPGVPSPSHVYRYYWLGEGERVSFQLYDHMTWDNSGSMTITITETTDPNNPIPEPTTMLAGLAGLAGLGRYVRKRS